MFEDLIQEGDRVRYNLDPQYYWFWQQIGTVIKVNSSYRNIIVRFDNPIYNMGSYFDGDTEIEMGRGCFEVIGETREPDWEI